MFSYFSFPCEQDVGLWLEDINLGSYRQIFKENGVNGEYLEGMSMFTTEQILRFIRKCHMKWGDFITLCKELRRIKGLHLLYLVMRLYDCQQKTLWKCHSVRPSLALLGNLFNINFWSSLFHVDVVFKGGKKKK